MANPAKPYRRKGYINQRQLSTMKKIVLAVTILVLCSLLCTQVPAQQQLTMTIWVDKGCGGEYFVGDMLTVNWSVSHGCEITFWEVRPDGTRRKETTQPVFTGAGEGSMGWTLKDEGYGRRGVYAEAFSPLWGRATAQCEFYVRKKAADINVTVRDQDGEPISGANVSLNGTFVASTDASGNVIIPEVDFGEHTITVQYEGEEQTSRMRIASTQKQFIEFVFTVEKRGSIQVRVFSQKGDPIENVDVYIDGFKEGLTSQDGTFTVSTAEGDHFVEVKYQDAQASQRVTVVKNQTTFADLTIYLEVYTTLSVFVKDETGNAVADANVYLDTIFLGRTDSEGKVEERATPGPHTVRVEKQGYNPSTQNTQIEEGGNTVTVVITAEDAAAYGILALLGFLYILKRRH